MMGKTFTCRMRPLIALSLSAALAWTPVRTRAADTIYVVVSAQSPVRSLAQKDVLALYTGRTRTLPGGESATPWDQQHDGAARADFYQARINSYWARLHFTGQVQPPRNVDDDAAMIQRLRADPTAIGYLTREPSDGSVRVVLRLP